MAIMGSWCTTESKRGAAGNKLFLRLVCCIIARLDPAFNTFIALIAFDKELFARQVHAFHSLSVGKHLKVNLISNFISTLYYSMLIWF